MDNIEFMMDIDAPKEKVWESIANQEKSRKWWGEKNLKIETKMGGEFLESQTQKDGTVSYARGSVIALVPNHRLSITWRKNDWDVDTLVTFYLLPQNGKTKLYFLHSEWNNLSAKIRDNQKLEMREKWKEKLANLKYFVESNTKTKV
jgi:uncharacterized protein YndB with AHSA1/START domain